MLTKDDLVLLLNDLEVKGIDIGNELNKVFLTEGISYSTLKFINDNRQLDVANFYELLRKNYNNKKSNLYKNLVKEEFESPVDAIITLSALNLQIMLFAKKLPDSKMFLKHSRAEEITQVLHEYYKSYDLIPCLKALRLIKNDLKCFEKIR